MYYIHIRPSLKIKARIEKRMSWFYILTAIVRFVTFVLPFSMEFDVSLFTDVDQPRKRLLDSRALDWAWRCLFGHSLMRNLNSQQIMLRMYRKGYFWNCLQREMIKYNLDKHCCQETRENGWWRRRRVFSWDEGDRENLVQKFGSPFRLLQTGN